MESGASTAGRALTTPSSLMLFLNNIISANIRASLMIWGPPGIGKSSVVRTVAEGSGLELTDLRLSQLAPTDLRGLPVPKDGVVTWYPPDFLPQGGRGILLLDEINMAPPTMQGVAQQLILDRRVGSYCVPDGWFIWAAGNRKEDRASVFEMPAPLANRFLHISVEPNFDSFREYALRHALHEQILAFLAFRPELLHKVSANEPAWPSPRSWEMASRLRDAGLQLAPAVGEAAASEFAAFVRVYETLPSLDGILAGNAPARFPDEPSARYAIVIGLTVRCAAGGIADPKAALNAARWLGEVAPAEWFQLFVSDLIRLGRSAPEGMQQLQPMLRDPKVRTAVAELRDLMFE